ncbi:MAG: ATP-dependent RNA helicase DbpA [Myxococcota bacterium]
MTDPQFSSLPLRPELLKAVADLGFVHLRPIQAAALPPALAGRDLVGQAQTGSGKTAAFALAVLNALDASHRGAQALILAPTRELAEQVSEDVRQLARRIPNTRVATVCGGARFADQQYALEQGAQVVVGTPGRVHDHLRRGTLVLDRLTHLVLDEADRMLDMGFIDEVQATIEHAPATRQTLLFSATFPPGIQDLSAQIQRDPVSISVGDEPAPNEVTQRVLRCEPGQRRERVIDLLATYSPSAALIFCETRSDCEAMGAALRNAGAPAMVLHGGLEQRDRDDAWLQFSNGSVRLLVATDVAARGLDLPGLPLVIVSELSPDPVAHLHRVGRTGRAGADGLAISVVVGPSENRRLQTLEDYLGSPLDAEPTPEQTSTLLGLKPAFQTLVLLSGKRDKLRKGDVLGALIKDAGLPPGAIGKIELTTRTCAVAIDRAHSEAALRHLQSGRVKNRRVRAMLL